MYDESAKSITKKFSNKDFEQTTDGSSDYPHVRYFDNKRYEKKHLRQYKNQIERELTLKYKNKIPVLLAKTKTKNYFK